MPVRVGSSEGLGFTREPRALAVAQGEHSYARLRFRSAKGERACWIDDCAEASVGALAWTVQCIGPVCLDDIGIQASGKRLCLSNVFGMIGRGLLRIRPHLARPE